MKIYVTNVSPSTIKLAAIDKYLLNKSGSKKYELSSEDFGTHIIDYSKNNVENMYRIEPTLNMDLHLIKYKGFSLLVDLTNYIQIPVVSQFPVNYVLTKMTCFEYCINKKSGIKLIVDCLIENGASLHKEIIPVNFYFTSSSNFMINQSNDNLFEEINMFLLELN
jgi:hypothetical protein